MTVASGNDIGYFIRQIYDAPVSFQTLRWKIVVGSCVKALCLNIAGLFGHLQMISYMPTSSKCYHERDEQPIGLQSYAALYF